MEEIHLANLHELNKNKRFSLITLKLLLYSLKKGFSPICPTCVKEDGDSEPSGKIDLIMSS